MDFNNKDFLIFVVKNLNHINSSDKNSIIDDIKSLRIEKTSAAFFHDYALKSDFLTFYDSKRYTTKELNILYKEYRKLKLKSIC